MTNYCAGYRRVIMHLMVAVLLMSCSSNFEKGGKEALSDLDTGKLQIKYWGDPINDSLIEEKNIQNIFKEKYGIEFTRIHGCGVARRIIENARGYNAVMKQAIKDKNGINFQEIFNKVYPAADQLAATRY